MLIHFLDLAGTIAFAISGALTAIDKKLDLFGIFIIASVTAIGGGTLRDVLIGDFPVGWLHSNHVIIYYILAATILTIIFKKQLNYLRKSIFLFDTIGIGVFTLIGIGKGLSFGLSPLACILLGTITACFGGVVRDILCNEIPVLFHKEIYAMACIMGGLIYFVFRWLHFPPDTLSLISIATTISIRILAVRYNWSLPKVY